ncbi:MAG: polyprenyl synthetase family protein [Cyanobacteria bacterium SIG32]|nr:polyprenyl synthetase family protein [Cyanobacteria bacterium SIG32]
MDKKITAIAQVVNADLERVNANLLFEVDLKPQLANEIEQFLKAPSKRIRSLITILYLRASKMYLLPAHYELLASVELIHNASLVHDDVIDESKLRRSRQTLNDKFDNQLAVISGDYLIGIALEKLVKIGSLSVLDVFAKTLQNMCKGEVNQYFNRFKKTDLESYIEKSTQKTALLFESALKSAILLAEEDYDEKTSEFALNFGLAFQIRDDLLNVMKKDKSKAMTDVDDGIYNAPLILSDDINDGIEKTKDLLNNYVNCAKQCIQDLGDSPYKKALIDLLELIKNV